jgi:hypothetical protein
MLVQIPYDKEELRCIRIFSVTGAFVTQYLRTNMFDVSNLEEGIYFLELTFENGERMASKIVKEN